MVVYKKIMEEIRRKMFKAAVIVVCIFSIQDTASGACDSGWTRYGNSCYYVGRTSRSWIGAALMCGTFGGSLVEIESSSENSFVTQFANRRNVVEFWIGATDDLVEGEFVWANSRNPLTYRNWKRGQPDNAGGHENCLQIVTRQGKWNDNNCNSHYRYVCEKSA